MQYGKSLLGQYLKPVTQRLSIFNKESKMPLSYSKLVRTLYLVLFTASSIISFTHYHTNAVIIAGLCLVGFISFDIVCYLRKKLEPAVIIVDPKIDNLIAKQEALEAKFNTVANDIGLAKIGAAFRR